MELYLIICEQCRIKSRYLFDYTFHNFISVSRNMLSGAQALTESIGIQKNTNYILANKYAIILPLRDYILRSDLNLKIFNIKLPMQFIRYFTIMCNNQF